VFFPLLPSVATALQPNNHFVSNEAGDAHCIMRLGASRKLPCGRSTVWEYGMYRYTSDTAVLYQCCKMGVNGRGVRTMVHWLSNGCQWNGAGTVHCNSCNHAMRITCKKKKRTPLGTRSVFTFWPFRGQYTIQLMMPVHDFLYRARIVDS
jgi:hypothetical protein